MWKEIKPEDCTDNPYTMIGADWMLIAAGDEEKANAMTASWGGVGIMWGKPAAFVVIRPQRCTKEFIDAGQTFSINFLPEEYRGALNYMGSVSGRDEDKMAGSGLTVRMADDTPAFEESRMTFICRKLFVQEMREESFLQPETVEKWYPVGDFHVLYIAEIEKVYVRED